MKLTQNKAGTYFLDGECISTVSAKKIKAAISGHVPISMFPEGTNTHNYVANKNKVLTECKKFLAIFGDVKITM